MIRNERGIVAALVMAGGLAACGYAQAQATVKADGKWRYALGAGLSIASGNTTSSTLTVNGDGVRKTQSDKWTFYGKALRARSDGNTTGEQLGLGTRYEADINERVFGFGQGDYLRDKPANLARRLSLGAGFGYHVIRADALTWDVFSGLGYTSDAYITPTTVAGAVRSTYGYGELLLGEESNHTISENSSFRQRVVVYPNLSNSGEFRAAADLGLSVAVNKTMSLTASLVHRYNSDPGVGLKNTDTLFVTGLSVRID